MKNPTSSLQLELDQYLLNQKSYPLTKTGTAQNSYTEEPVEPSLPPIPIFVQEIVDKKAKLPAKLAKNWLAIAQMDIDLRRIKNEQNKKKVVNQKYAHLFSDDSNEEE